jgi:hypothetical protein
LRCRVRARSGHSHGVVERAARRVQRDGLHVFAALSDLGREARRRAGLDAAFGSHDAARPECERHRPAQFRVIRGDEFTRIGGWPWGIGFHGRRQHRLERCSQLCFRRAPAIGLGQVTQIQSQNADRADKQAAECPADDLAIVEAREVSHD